MRGMAIYMCWDPDTKDLKLFIVGKALLCPQGRKMLTSLLISPSTYLQLGHRDSKGAWLPRTKHCLGRKEDAGQSHSASGWARCSSGPPLLPSLQLHKEIGVLTDDALHLHVIPALAWRKITMSPSLAALLPAHPHEAVWSSAWKPSNTSTSTAFSSALPSSRECSKLPGFSTTELLWCCLLVQFTPLWKKKEEMEQQSKLNAQWEHHPSAFCTFSFFPPFYFFSSTSWGSYYEQGHVMLPTALKVPWPQLNTYRSLQAPQAHIGHSFATGRREKLMCRLDQQGWAWAKGWGCCCPSPGLHFPIPCCGNLDWLEFETKCVFFCQANSRSGEEMSFCSAL